MGLLASNKYSDNKKINSAINHQKNHVRHVLNDNHEVSIGLVRILRILLVYSSFIFPSLYIRNYFGKRGLLSRKLAIDFYVFIKMIIPILFMINGMTYNIIVKLLIIYLIAETVIYISGLIFLADTYISPLSIKRSILLVIINYIEVTFSFAALYQGFSAISIPDSIYVMTYNGIRTISGDLASTIGLKISTIDALYFSFVTSTTLGFGDCLPVGFTGKFLVITQIVVMFLFVILFINYFSSKLNANGNSRQNEKHVIDKVIKQELSKSQKWNYEKKALLLEYLRYLDQKDN